MTSADKLDQHLRDLADSLWEALVLVDAENRIVWANHTLSVMLGTSELATRSAPGLLTPDAPDKLLRAFASVRDTGRNWSGYLSGRRVSSQVPWHMEVLVTQARESQLMMAIRDITEEQLTREALRQALRDLRNVIEKTPDGYALVRDGRYVYANSAWCRMLGMSDPERLTGSDLLARVHHEDRSTLVDELDKLRGPTRRDEPAAVEVRLAKHDGGWAVVELTAVDIIGFEGRPACFLVARDLTHRRKVQSQLMLSDRMASLGTLAAGVAHEINNPLAYVGANLDYLSEKLGEASTDLSPAEMTEILGEMRDGVQRVKRVVGQLKSYTRSDERRHRLKLENVVETGIKLAWNEVRYRAHFRRDYQDAPDVIASEPRLVQLVVNLLVNASQAVDDKAPDESEIVVRLGKAADGRGLIEVSDNGVGIPDEIADRIFDPFFTTKPVGLGTGLGLSICHTIVTSLGGEISFRSKPGIGTTFSVLLPVAATNSREIAPVRRRRPPVTNSPSGRILLVDDEAHVARALRRALIGHDVFICDNGRDAVELIVSTEPFDVILCDLNMPDVTGMDVYDEVREKLPGIERRFIFMTGGAFTRRSQEFLEEITNPRIDKPFDLTEVRELVASRVQLRTRFQRAVAPPQ